MKKGCGGASAVRGVPRPEATSVVGCRVRGILNFECVNFELLPCPPCPPSPPNPHSLRSRGRASSPLSYFLLPTPDSLFFRKIKSDRSSQLPIGNARLAEI
ncbi:hypothetical protein [Chroococcidiopsis cubana]|uniref:hypothetical protein n=1 Tax=Chroococcidiopsis cubana TaxID=171392 RepID=UPI00131549E4|nr:hypothetical protein [Chroococcidiopsis cubana]